MTQSTRSSSAIDQVLDRRVIQDRVAMLLGADGRGLVSVEPHYVRHKPGRSSLLGLSLEWSVNGASARTLASLYLGSDARPARTKAEALRPIEPERGRAICGDDHALMLAFPNDRTLRGLSAAADPRRLGNRLVRSDGALGGGWRVRARRSSIEVVRWKPERRAVLRTNLSLADDVRAVRSRLAAWIRVVEPARLCELVDRWRVASASPGLTAPGILDVDPERGLLVTSEVAGEPFVCHLNPRSGAWDALAAALTALRSAEPPASAADHSDDSVQAAADRTLDALAEVDAEQASHALALKGRLAAFRATLAPRSPSTVHGDLTADQVLVNGDDVALLDWDELGTGDAHLDFGSLAADLRLRGEPAAVERVSQLARESLGQDFDPMRLGWHLAAAECRIALHGLQRARTDWREEARRALAAATAALTGPARLHACQSTPSVGSGLLAGVLDPLLRGGLDACAGGPWTVTAVWPEQGHVAVRLERAPSTGGSVRWLRVGREVSHHEPPQDPDLSDLAPLMASGRFQLVGHRLGRRAALREPASRRFLFLRPPRKYESAYQAVVSAHLRLCEAGVPHAQLQGRASGVSGWWMEEVEGPGATLALTSVEVWERLGSDLARVHSQLTCGEEPVDGVTRALEAARTQIARGARPEGELAKWLWERVEGLKPSGAATPAWIHGDLHPGQIVVRGGGPVMLDWERAGLGEAEQDLGNLAAHWAFEDESRGRIAWQAMQRGYLANGRKVDRLRFVSHLRAALLRVLAIHGWRDAGRARAMDIHRWDRFLEECESW